MGVHRFTDLRAWQTCNEYKKAIYRLCADGLLSRDFERRDQLERSAGRPCAHLSEGFGRFSPPDFARYCVMARSSLMESQKLNTNGEARTFNPERRVSNVLSPV